MTSGQYNNDRRNLTHQKGAAELWSHMICMMWYVWYDTCSDWNAYVADVHSLLWQPFPCKLNTRFEKRGQVERLKRRSIQRAHNWNLTNMAMASTGQKPSWARSRGGCICWKQHLPALPILHFTIFVQLAVHRVRIPDSERHWVSGTQAMWFNRHKRQIVGGLCVHTTNTY